MTVPGRARAGVVAADVEAGIRAAVDDARAGLVDLCARLVAAQSPNPPGDTRAVAAVVAETLEAAGIRAELVAADATMPSVVAHVSGAGDGPHLVVNVHLDTMPPGDEAAWTVPVHELTRRDGRLYGLGMGNMKGAVAAMLLAVRLLHERRDAWGGQLTFTAVSDECVFGEHGAAHLLRTRADEVVGDALICGEGPGFARLAPAEKGVAWYELTATGPAGHASRARTGGTAPARLAAALVDLDGLNDVVAVAPAGLGVTADDDPEAFRLSVNAGVLAGGTFISQQATTARAEIDVRLPPGLSMVDFEERLHDVVAAHPDVAWRRIKGWDANWSGLDEPIVATFAAVEREVRGRAPVSTVRLPASDASRWRALGVPAVCYGPQPTLSAGVDDYAEEQDVVDCAAVYALTALRYLEG